MRVKKPKFKEPDDDKSVKSMRLKDMIFSEMVSLRNPRYGRKETVEGRVKRDVVIV